MGLKSGNESMSAERIGEIMQLGYRAESLLAKAEAPHEMVDRLDGNMPHADAALDWFREQLLGEQRGTLKTGGVTGEHTDG